MLTAAMAELLYGPFCKKDDDCERGDHDGPCGPRDGGDRG